MVLAFAGGIFVGSELQHGDIVGRAIAGQFLLLFIRGKLSSRAGGDDDLAMGAAF